MPTTLKRKGDVTDDSDSDGTHADKKAKTDLSFQESDKDEDEELESMEEEDSEEEEDLTSANRGKRKLKELDQISFDNIRVMEAGTIARVEVVNFMCHSFLKIDFGPKINFVIGHNGSGKSAILTAITIALGASASSTNRGKNLGSFIKEGEKGAIITIHLTNGGDAPYKPDLYPDFIVIERRINKDGASPYKLKNSSGKVVSTKKEDLVAILDHMNLMVNNPLTILTQDMARKFLSDSSPEEKYKLFMHGTQLTQLQTDFRGIRESLETARTILDRKRLGLPGLQAMANEAKKKFEDSAAARELEDRVEDLNNEMVWAQIIQKEKEAKKAKRDAEIIEMSLNQIQEAYDIEKKKLDDVNEAIVKVNDDLQAFQNEGNPDLDEIKRLEEQKADKELKIRSFKGDLQELNNAIGKLRHQRNNAQKTLDTERNKLESSSRIKHDEINDQIDKLNQTIKEKVTKATQFRAEQQDLERQIENEKFDRQKYMNKLTELGRKKDEVIRLIKNLESQRGDKMKAYGANMPDVLEAIKRETRWQKRRPVGPFGATLQLLKPQFADTLESVLNRQLMSFVVETFSDRALLMQILNRFKMNVPVVISDYDIFDYSHGEPDEKYLTCIRALEFSDEWVKRQLIVSSKIEKMLLMEDRQEADRIMASRPTNIDLCFTSHGYKVGGKQGMKTESIENYRGPPRFQKDLDGEIKKNENLVREITQEREKLSSQAGEAQSNINRLEKNLKDCKNMERKLQYEISRLEQEVDEKKESLKEAEPANLDMFHDEIKECDDKIRQKVNQFKDITNQQSTAVDEAKEIIRQIRALQLKENDHESHINEFRKKLEKLEDIKRKLNDELRRKNVEKQNIKLRYESKYSLYVDGERSVREWTEQAQTDYPDRVETERLPTVIEKEIVHLQNTVKNMEAEAGVTTDMLRTRAIEATNQFNQANDIVKGMDKLYRSLKKMLQKRQTKWEVFRQYISISAAHYFSYYLHMRGDEGKLRFNHDAKKLDIRVSTGDQYIKGSRQKDSRSLSGGEKSFSQISFLLSLWQSISSPVICLDEFDVFMDAINRKQTMKMIMNAASDNSSQYILITPQDASNMEPGPYVTVHRLADPERN